MPRLRYGEQAPGKVLHQLRRCGGAAAGRLAAASPAASEEAQYGFHQCTFHPEVETGLACGKCGQYICPRCMIQTPVGARCRDCAQVTRHPTYDVSTGYYLRASGASVIVGIVGGILWALTLGIPFLPWLLAGGAGFAVGEAVSLMSNRKRGRGLIVIAVVGVTISVLTVVATIQAFPLLLLLPSALAYYMAIIRVR